MFSTRNSTLGSPDDSNTIFSTHNPALVPHFDGVVAHTRYSASTNRTNGDLQCDLIAFLSIVQRYNVDYLPITWQPTLSNLGVGSSGTISQSTFITDMPLAFKRFHIHDSEHSDEDFLPLISEVLILSQPHIQNHTNIVNLEGICWEIKRRTEKAVPVLVFEKAAWDLQQFMNVSEGMNMTIDERLKICADIGSAIMALHVYDVIHGDIKPQNVLVFKDTTGKTTVKVTDFGYSTLVTGEEGSVFLPKSRPWNAPEHHFGEFKPLEAKKADVYSLGMLCLWVLFGNHLSDIPQTTTGGTELISFDAPFGHLTLLEHLKDQDKVEHIAHQLMESIPGINDEYRIRLKELFSLTLPLNPEKRTSDLGKLIGFLDQERMESEPEAAAMLETTRELSRHADFRLAENLANFVQTDYRVRTNIRDSLEKCYTTNQNRPYAAHIAFQAAFCYLVGFGAKSDDDKCRMWLEICNKQLDDLNMEKGAVQPASWKNVKITASNGLMTIDLIHEYRTWGLNKLEEVQRVYERETSDMAQQFGENHFVPLALYNTLGDLLETLGKFGDSKALRMRIRVEIQKTDKIGQLYYIQSIINLAKSHTKLGEWVEAQQLYEEILKRFKGTVDQEHQSTLASMANLAMMFWNQGRWKEAEVLEVQVMEMRKRVLGKEHPETLTSMVNLASTYQKQGRLKEAENLNLQAMETFKKVLGQEHPSTLSSMANLASTYGDQGRWKEAKMLKVQVMEMFKRILGQEHPDTLTSIGSLASTYKDQGRWKEAEELEVQVIKARKRVLGDVHPDTLISVGNLASTYSKQGRWNEAERLFIQVVETRKSALGQEHPDTLTTTANLASMYRNQGRLNEAEELEVLVMETTKRVLGQEHPDTLTTMANLASTYGDLGRWNEAEELKAQVVDMRKRVLGQEHPDTLISMANLASTFWNQWRLKEAEELEVQVMEIRKRVLGQEHSDTLISMGNLASTYRNQGRLKEAEVLEVQVIEGRKMVLGHEHPDTLFSVGNLASTYNKQGRWKEAEVLEVQVMETFKRVLGQQHPATLISMDNLASTYRNQGRWKETEVLEVQVMDTRKQVLGQGHPDTLISIGNLASTYSHQGRWMQAEVLEVQVMETKKSVLGQEHPDTLISMGNLASTYSKQGRLKEAEVLEVQVMEAFERVLGQDHTSTLISMDNLASTYRSQGRWKEAEELMVQVANRRRTTLGEDHPSTVSAINNLIKLQKNREVLRGSPQETRLLT